MCLGTAQNSSAKYDEFKKMYSHFPENDPDALPYITKSIADAKKSGNKLHLLRAYEDGAFSSPDRLHKLKYADSCILTAKNIQDASLLSMAYLGKGIIYYFNFRKFDDAVAHYLLASRFAEKTENLYLQYRIKYQIGVAKSYAGYTKDALIYLNECLLFFESNLRKNLHPHERYNNTRGYLNTLHQISICERQNDQHEKAQLLLSKAIPYLTDADYQQENGYYLKERGILAFHDKAYPEAIDLLQSAETILLKKKEESYLSSTYYYMGASYLLLKEWDLAHAQFKKVDSLFARNECVSGEVLKTYELLLKNRNFEVTKEDMEHYIDQLLIAERILKEDMPQLSAKIQREYDARILLAEKAKLENEQGESRALQSVLIGVGSSVLLFLILLSYRHRKIRQRYRALMEKLEQETVPAPLMASHKEGRKVVYSDAIVNDLLKKLEAFEQKTYFVDPDFSSEKLTKILDTNKNHLSYVLNKHRGLHFNQYRAFLRIRYMTHLMNSDPKYLKYTIDALAKMSGMKSRQQFNKFFKQFNKITPSQFIEQKNKDLLMP